MKKRLLILYIISIVFIPISYSQVPVIYYDFESNTDRTVGEYSVEQSVTSGCTQVVRVGSGNFGTTLGAGNFNGGTNTNAGKGQAIQGSSWNASTTDPGTNATKFFELTINTTGLSGISIGFDYYATGAGPADIGVLWSIDGTNFTNSGLDIATSYDVAWHHSNIYSLSNQIDNQSSVIIRIYAYQGTNSNYAGTGYLRLDNLTFYANSITASCSLLDYDAVGLSLKSGTSYSPSYTNLTIHSSVNTVSFQSNLTLSGNLIVTSGTVALGTKTINVAGNFSNNGTIVGTGNIQLNGTLLQTLSGTGSVSNLILNNTNGATIASGITTITNSYTPSNGILLTNGNLVLQSNANSTAYIAQGNNNGGYITGNVTTQLYIPAGYRKYRFLSHPFNSNQALNILTNNIDITGVGGNTNGFTTTLTNNSSAFYFNTTNADGNATNDAGWNAFTATNTTNWKLGQGIRLLIRGTKGQANSLDGTPSGDGTNGTYYPAAVTLNMTGQINAGATTINLVTGGSGTTAGFNLVGNPFPSALDIGTVINANNNVVHAVYIRNPQTSSYTTIPISGSYILPAYSAFFIKANTATSLTFNENNKSTCNSCATVFGYNEQKNRLQLKILVDEIMWDNFYLHTLSEEQSNSHNAYKLMNDHLSIYGIAGNNEKLAIQNIQLNVSETIVPIGLVVNNTLKNKTITLQVANCAFSDSIHLFLLDRLTNTKYQLHEGFRYNFIANNTDSTTMDDQRFAVVVQKSFISAITQDATENFSCYINNPFSDNFIIHYTSPLKTKATITITNSVGQIIASKSIMLNQVGKEIISMQNCSTGIYYVTIDTDKGRISKKILKIK